MKSLMLKENLIDKLSIGVAVTDQNGQILVINKAIKEITGFKEREIKTLADWYQKAYPDPEYRKKVKRFFQYDLENDIENRTHKVKTATGDYKYLNFRYSKLKAGKILFEIIDISEQIKQKKDLENQKIIFENLFTNSLEAIVFVDQNLKILEVNKKFEEIFEVQKNKVLNKYALNAVNLFEDTKDIKKEMKKLSDNDYWEDEVRFKVNGKLKYCNVHIFSVNNKEHKKLTYIAIDDITEIKNRAQELKEVKERLELAVTGSNIGIWDWDLEKKYIHFNNNWAQMLGYEISELGNNFNTWLDLVHPDDKEAALKDLEDHLDFKTKKYSNEHRLKTKSGKWKWIRDMGKITEHNSSGQVKRMVGVHIDIDEEKRSAKKIEYLSNHDELTGLYNRRYFNEEFKRLYESCRHPISIIVGDLNNLKSINDNYGHLMGDRYIQLTAAAIKKSLRTEDLVARIGGDEFAMILPETNYNKAKAICERILTNIEKQNIKADIPEQISIALGCNSTTSNNQKNSYQNFKKCYNMADQEMYEEKFKMNSFC